MKTVATIIFALLLMPCAGAGAGIAEADLARARAELRRALDDEPKFIKVHAAEALIELELGEDVRRVFEEERRLHETEPAYRIGIWRVLARTSKTPAERQAFVERIVAAYADPMSTDAVNAVETLAKLDYTIPASDRRALERWTERTTEAGRSYGRWLLAVSGDAEDVRRLADLLTDPHRPTRGTAAYSLRFMAAKLPRDVVAKVADAADAADDRDPRAYLFSAAFVTASDEARRDTYRAKLAALLRKGDKAERYEVFSAFAECGDDRDLPLILPALREPDLDPDVRVSAARALLMIDRRMGQAKR